jgi:hypothetical protein
MLKEIRYLMYIRETKKLTRSIQPSVTYYSSRPLHMVSSVDNSMSRCATSAEVYRHNSVKTSVRKKNILDKQMKLTFIHTSGSRKNKHLDSQPKIMSSDRDIGNFLKRLKYAFKAREPFSNLRRHRFLRSKEAIKF